MTLYDYAFYFVTMTAIALAPGPVVLMLLVRSVSDDVRGAIGFGLGFSIGGIAVISLVCFGLSVWITKVPAVFAYIKIVMLAYILWIAWGVWRKGIDLDCAGSQIIPRRNFAKSVFAGVAICFVSPYLFVFFPFVLPSMMDMTAIKMSNFAILAAVTFLARGFGAGLIIWFAVQLRQLIRSPFHAKLINRALASLLIACGGLLVLS